MRVLFHEAMLDSGYSPDPHDNAALPGRLEPVVAALREDGHAFESAGPASRAQLALGHSHDYIASVEAHAPRYRMAALAAGLTCRAAERAFDGEPAFACVRPPGHHASRGQAWGHCTFSNVALALLHLRAEGRIASATVVDFDLHTGDGTLDVLRNWSGITVINPWGEDAVRYLSNLRHRLDEAPPADVLAVSAGFDAYLKDLGRKLGTADFAEIGRLLRLHAERATAGRRFAALEGGYYLPDLGLNIAAFCRGFA